MTEPDRGDELLQRYRDASAQDAARPGTHVQARVRAHAEMVIAANREAAAATAGAPPAANQSRWKLSALAGVAVLGLSGLLFLQFERGTPEEKDAAFGQARQNESTSPAAPSAPAGTAPAGQSTAAATPQAAMPERAKTVASPPPPSAPTAAAVSPAAPAPSPLQDGMPGNLARAPAAKDESAAAAPAAAMAPSPPAAAAPEARTAPPRTLQKSQSAPAFSAGPARASAGNGASSAQAILDAASTGNVRELAALLQQGAPVDSVDEAGRTPLMRAAMRGHADAVRQLLLAGAATAAIDRDGLDAARLARRQGFEEIARLIESRN